MPNVGYSPNAGYDLGAYFPGSNGQYGDAATDYPYFQQSTGGSSSSTSSNNGGGNFLSTLLTAGPAWVQSVGNLFEPTRTQPIIVAGGQPTTGGAWGSSGGTGGSKTWIIAGLGVVALIVILLALKKKA